MRLKGNGRLLPFCHRFAFDLRLDGKVIIAILAKCLLRIRVVDPVLVTQSSLFKFAKFGIICASALVPFQSAFADPSEIEATSPSTTLSVPGNFFEKLGPGSYDFGGTLTFETSGSAVADTPVAAAAAYMIRPTLTLKNWDLETSFLAVYNQFFSADPNTGAIPDGAFDSHVITVAKAIGPVVFGLSGALPANQAARDFLYDGSFGPTMQASSKYDRWTVSETLLYQHRFFHLPDEDDGVARDTEAVKSLTEVGYQLTDALTLSGSALTVFTLSPSQTDYGIRSQVSIDYRSESELTTSCGIAIERGLSTLEGVSGKTDLAQAFVDFIVEM